MAYLTYLGQLLRRTLSSGLVGGVLFGCGGLMEDGTPGAGGYGSTVSGGASSGSTTSVSSTMAVTPDTVCYGIVDTTSASMCVGITTTVGPLEADACIFTVPIATGMQLEPSYLRLYFDDESGRLEVPYVGAASACPTTGTAGGWYATNTAGGTSDIGLCGCTCMAAQSYALTVVIDCAGVEI